MAVPHFVEELFDDRVWDSNLPLELLMCLSACTAPSCGECSSVFSREKAFSKMLTDSVRRFTVSLVLLTVSCCKSSTHCEVLLKLLSYLGQRD
jgi:hypothetical protein